MQELEPDFLAILQILEQGGVQVHVASVDDLIAMKTAAGRPKDQNHVMELRALRELTAEYHPHQ